METKRSRRLPWAVVLLIVTFSCLIAFGAAQVWNRFHPQSLYSYRLVEIGANEGLQVVDDGFVYYDGNTISMVGTDANVRWNYYFGADAGFYANRYGVAAWADTTLTLIDAQSGTTTYSGTMDGEVLSAHIGERYTAVLLGPEHNSTIVLMEKSGRKVNSITLPRQTVIDYGFLSNGSLLWEMSLDTTGTVPSCTVNTYRPGKEIVGSIHDKEQLVYGTVFQSSYFCCVGESHLKIYDYTGSEDRSRRRLVYGWYMATVDENTPDDPMMAFVPNDQYGGDSDIQDVRLIRANLDQQIRMPYGCQSLIARGSRVYGFSTQGYVAIAIQGQKQVTAYQLPMLFDQVYGVTLDNVVVLGKGNTIYMLNLS